MVILTGVMAGALRALWPWVDETNRALAPSGDVGLAVGLAALGFSVVTVVLVADHRRSRRTVREAEPVADASA